MERLRIRIYVSVRRSKEPEAFFHLTIDFPMPQKVHKESCRAEASCSIEPVARARTPLGASSRAPRAGVLDCRPFSRNPPKLAGAA